MVSLRILVVEDSTKLALLLKRGLEEQRYAVDVVSCGDEAVWMAVEHDYDAVILDVTLGGIDGFEVCRRLRQRSRWAPVLMLTARHSIHDRVRGLDVGADDYLTKPFAFVELEARLRALLRRGAGRRPVRLQVGDLTFDPATREARRGEQLIRLTAKESALLEYLMRHAGEALSRAQLIEHVWDFAFHGDPNVLTVYIGYLREKIDGPFGRASVETVRGIGYRLRDDTEAPSRQAGSRP